MSGDAPSGERRPERVTEHAVTATGVLAESVRRLVRDPVMAVPFLAAGVVLSLVDWLRVRDPVPTTHVPQFGEVTVSVSFFVSPSGLRATGVRPAALVDLRPRYLVWTVGLELLALVAVAVAGWLTLSRAAGVGPSRNRLVTYLVFVVATRLLLGAFSAFDGLAWVTLLAFVALLVVFVRLFAAPALVVAGGPDGDGLGIRAAAGRSSRLARGRGPPVFGLVLAVGLATWFLGSVPAAGALVSTAMVAPVHAVAVVVFVESVADGTGRR